MRAQAIVVERRASDPFASGNLSQSAYSQCSFSSLECLFENMNRLFAASLRSCVYAKRVYPRPTLFRSFTSRGKNDDDDGPKRLKSKLEKELKKESGKEKER